MTAALTPRELLIRDLDHCWSDADERADKHIAAIRADAEADAEAKLACLLLTIDVEVLRGGISLESLGRLREAAR